MNQATVEQLQAIQNERESMARGQSGIRGQSFFNKADEYVEATQLQEAI